MVQVGDSDCPHAPACSAETGCHDGKVTMEWVVRCDGKGGVWRAFSWRHPREDRMHRSERGEPMTAPPKWAK